jgi:hypothetical protein
LLVEPVEEPLTLEVDDQHRLSALVFSGGSQITPEAVEAWIGRIQAARGASGGRSRTP